MILFEVNIDDIVPVIIAINEIPDNIIIIAKKRPKKVWGVKSPYPTVVIVTIVHHRAVPILSKLFCSIKVITKAPLIHMVSSIMNTAIIGFLFKIFIYLQIMI